MKALFSGVALAAVTGLLLGGAMKPNLNGAERPEGPQMFAGWSGARSTGPFDDGASFASYRGQIPEYVVGTDWQRAEVVAQDVAYEPPAAPDYYQQAVADRTTYAAPRYEEPAREAPKFPSLSGGVARSADTQGSDAAAVTRDPAPAQPKFDEEAPPEATGDTSRIKG